MRTLFVVEGGHMAGLGHLVRSGVLATQLVRMGHASDLLLCGDAEALIGRAWPAGGRVKTASGTAGVDRVCQMVAELHGESGYDWIVIDGYGFSGSSVKKMSGNGRAKTLVIDDVAGRELDVDLLLNQNVQSNASYAAKPVRAAMSLFGPRYALLDGCYVSKRRNAEPDTAVERILVSFGGVDRRGRTMRVLELLEEVPDVLDIEVVVGPYFPVLATLRTWRGRHRLSLRENLPDLAEPMSRCDLMISSGGSTVWQACCVGAPLMVFQTVDNQQCGVETLSGNGAALCADASTCRGLDAGIDPMIFARNFKQLLAASVRRSLMANAQELVDGGGAQRVAQVMLAGL